jgi:PAS domain S-box-containing protein
MKQITFLDGQSKKYAQVQKEAKQKRYTSLLIQLSFVCSKKKRVQERLDAIAKDFPDAIIIGTAVVSKKIAQKKKRRSLQLSFSFFQRIALEGSYQEDTEFKNQDSLIVVSVASRKKNYLLFGTTLYKSGSAIATIISKREDSSEGKTSITFDATKHNVALMNQYKDAVDASALVSKTDKRGYITYVNEHFCKVSKYSKEELLGKNHNIVRDPNVSSKIFKKMWENLLNGKVWKGSFSNRAKDGSRYYVDATIMPIFNNRGEIEEFIAIRQDITKQVEITQRVQEKERLIRAILDNQESIVIHASKIEGMQSVNKKLFDYFDFKSFEDFKLKHSCICDLFIEEDGYVNVKQNPNWLDDIASHEDRDYKVKMRTKTGKIHTFTIRTKRIQNEYIINLYDITKLEEALLRAYSSERAKSLFLANMSHEIRTPLNGILGFTALLIKKELAYDVKRYVEIIHKSGETLLSVVNDILDFSKLESGELQLYETETNLFEEMEATVATFASLANKKKIDYSVYIDTKIPKSVRCDIQRIKQVMNNLISNAIKFTPEEGTVIVRVELLSLQDDKVKLHFSVKDSGIGIAKDKIATIFEAFSQADNSISREFGGTGLGLAISNQYITMMGSHIELKSEEGEGSEFFFELEFDVVDATSSVKDCVDESIAIALVKSPEGAACGTSEIVYDYLDAWQCNYKEIDTLSELNESFDVVIVCTKFFDSKQCQELLERYKRLKVIYIEGSQNRLECQHERLYIIEQPMTGSVLFDRLISLLDPSFFVVKEDKIKKLPPYKGRILVAEDNETNQMLMAVFLEERELAYKIVQNGQELLDVIEAGEEYDLIFMDINMPILDGIGATKALRSQGFTKPIVSLSANVIESDTTAFREAGMDDILNKPIIQKELDAILQKYLFSGITEKRDAFDVIDPAGLAKELFFPDLATALRLLRSLRETFERALEELEESDTDYEALLHRLKGAAGNMRFEKLYALVMMMEEESEPSKEHLELLVEHLCKAIENIDALGEVECT